MSENNSQFRAIAGRRQAIGVELESLRTKIAALEEENTELEIAAKVLSRLGLLIETTEPELPLQSETDSGEKTTVVQKIKQIVSDFEAAGVKGISGSQIVSEMSKRWAISDPNAVRPTIWRMVKANTLIKNGEIYSVANQKPFGGLRP